MGGGRNRVPAGFLFLHDDVGGNMEDASKRPAKKKTGAQRDQEKRLTDAYAATGRKDELLKGDELSELEPVGQKPSGRKR
jgi:hypothetical protein